MITRLAGLVTMTLFTMGAATGPEPEAASVRECRADSRLARDGDVRAGWDKLIDARARLEPPQHRRALAAYLDHQLSYVDWRPSVLASMSTQVRGHVQLCRHAITELSTVVGEWVAMVWSALATMVHAFLLPRAGN